MANFTGGGTGGDYANSIQPTSDGGYIIAGYSLSNNGDVTGHHGYQDYWIVKLNSTLSLNEPQNVIVNFQITPNPFSEITSLSFQLISSKTIQIEIHDLEGRLIKNLNTKNLNTSKNELAWDATNNAGSKVDDGVYFITIHSDSFSETKKVVLIKN